MFKKIVVFVFIVIVLSLTACGKKLENPLHWKVQDFSAINQEGNKLELADLKDQVWIAEFIFTNCTTVCSPMTAHLAALQKRLAEEGLKVTFVTFSVDPERDTPEVLKEFGQKFGSDFSNWQFLTGYSRQEIKQLSEESFKSSLIFETGTDQVMHGTAIFLVDPTGTIVKRYNGLDSATDEQLIDDVKILLNK